MDLDIEGNAALVTASTSGLGHACAEALSKEGVNVTICGRSEDQLAYACDRLNAMGEGDILGLQADVRDPDNVKGLVEETVDQFGGIDHLVTSAGGPPSGSFMETEDTDWFQAFDQLLMSNVWTTREAYPHLEESDHGSIVNILSRTVREASDELVLSNSVRRAVLGLTETQAREFAPEVRVNAVLPGPHETSRLEELAEDAVERGEYEEYRDAIQAFADEVPLDRVGQPIELGDVVAFLSSPRASFVNGASVPIDGGAIRE
jgi:glucose 1-dehydrogenase/3-oxoacyl-[acyl-carrier protein] reductase